MSNLLNTLEHALRVYLYTWLGLLAMSGTGGLHVNGPQALTAALAPSAVAAGAKVLEGLSARLGATAPADEVAADPAAQDEVPAGA